MKPHSIARAACLVLFLSAGLALAQDWALKDSGNQAFAAWIQGPPTDLFKNQHSTPLRNDKTGETRQVGTTELMTTW